ncbi:MAG TPA: DUF1302 family protein [Polyangiaceae bacterium]
MIKNDRLLPLENSNLSHWLLGAVATFAMLTVSARDARAQGQPAPPATPPPAAAPVPATPAPETPPAAPPPATTPPAAAESAAPAATSAETSAEATSGEASTGSGGGLFEQAQSEADSAESESGGSSWPFDLNGYVRGDAYVGKVPAGDGRWETKAAYGEFALKLRTKKQTYGDAYAETRFRYGLQAEETGAAVDVREAYVNGYFGPVDVRLGQQVIVWGRADAFNPTNNLTPFDLRVHSPVDDDRRMGNLAARVFLNLDPIRIEGVWVPLYRAAEIPSVAVPWYVEFKDTDFPQPDLKNGTEAVRVHLELPAFEMSASYLYGYAPLPGLALSEIALATDTPVHIKRQAYDHHVVGLDFSTAIGDLMGVRGEAAFRFPMHFRSRIYAPNPDLQYALGLDRAFGSINVIAQYMGRYTFDWKREQSQPAPEEDIRDLTSAQWAPWEDNPPGTVEDTIARATTQANSQLYVTNQMLFSQLERVQHLATVRIEWLTLHDTLSLSALGFMNFSTQEWLVFPKLGYQISDALSTSVGAEIYGGPKRTLFGQIDAQLSAGYAELRYSF